MVTSYHAHLVYVPAYLQYPLPTAPVAHTVTVDCMYPVPPEPLEPVRLLCRVLQYSVLPQLPSVQNYSAARCRPKFPWSPLPSLTNKAATMFDFTI